MASSSSRSEEVIEIGSAMWTAGVPLDFVSRAITLSERIGGILELMEKWRDDEKEREATISALRELVGNSSE